MVYNETLDNRRPTKFESVDKRNIFGQRRTRNVSMFESTMNDRLYKSYGKPNNLSCIGTKMTKLGLNAFGEPIINAFLAY